MGVPERPTLLLLLSLLLLPLGLPVLCAPPRLICDSRVLERYILEAKEAENVTMGCAEGPRLSENITVPDTKVNFYAWKRKEVEIQAVEVWQGLSLLSEAILQGQALLANSSAPPEMLQLHVDKAISGLRSLTSLLRVLGAQKESISPPDATPPAPLRTHTVDTFCKLFRVYSNFLRGKLKLYTGEVCRRGDRATSKVPHGSFNLDSDAAGGGCLGPESITSLFVCDFEDNFRPFCDWSQMTADDGDWVRTTGPAPTGTSGPPGGYPNGEGYYLHMDASTFPRGGVARLRSPDIWEQGPLCIHFAFHMFGLSWGAQLRLLLLRGQKHHRPIVLWKHVNTQSPSWMPTTVTVPANRDIPSWLMFEGMRGNTAYLDISLDGLSLQRGTCNRICMSQMCSFDTLNDLCGWSWVPTATGAKWTQKKGPSGKSGVGPDEDFSSPGNGYYMLLDSTNARPGQKAVLLSPLSHSSGCLTLSFHYMIRGQSPGEGLFVYATFLGNIRKHSLFSGHVGPNWQAVSVNYTGPGQIQFMVVGVFGETPEPAIAVDAISIAPCGETFPQCNFEDRIRPFCDWSHVFKDVGHWSWGSKSVPTPISGPPREFPYGAKKFEGFGEHYIYFDSVKLSQVGQSARLVSPPFCAPGDICVEFAYHMYGLGEGTSLKLLLGSPAGSSPVSLWSRVGSQSTGWLNSSVTIPKGHQQPMQLFLKATRGTSTAFVVAVNFILISHGQCRAQGIELSASYQLQTCDAFASASLVTMMTGDRTVVSCQTVLLTAEPSLQPRASPMIWIYFLFEIEVTKCSLITHPLLYSSIATEIPSSSLGLPTGYSETAFPMLFTETATAALFLVSTTAEMTTVPTKETMAFTEMSTPATEVSTHATEVPTITREASTATTEISTPATEVSTPATEVSTPATEVSTLATEVSTPATEVSTLATEVSTPAMEVSTPATEVSTVATEVTAATTEVSAIATEMTAVTTEMTAVTTEMTAVTTEEASVTSEETTPTETIPTEVTNVPPEEISVPPEEISIPPEETTVLTQMPTTCRPPCQSPSHVPGVLTSIAPATGISTTEICPVNAHFEWCACPASCESPKPNCQPPCSPGCVCNPGYLFSNNQCINESFCNCFYSNKYYKPGEEWFSPNCTERCRCMLGSRMECQISQCGTHTICRLKNDQYECHPYGSATCLVYGDLHFITFDERHIGFTGTCTYILVQTCDNFTDPYFKITASTQERGVEGVSSLDKVFITLPETSITLIRDRQTLIEDQRVTLPAILSNGIFVGLSGRFVELRTTFGLRVRWDGDQQLFVTVPSTYSRKLCGFCGNYDGDSSNDNRMPDGTMTDDEEELGRSWQAKEDENIECQKKKNPPSCDAALGQTMLGPMLCGQLADPRGVFEACLLYMKVSPFLDNCVMDMCSFQGLQQMLCAHMSVMTATCQDAGYAVMPWREPQFCPLLCPQNSRYSLCAKPCPDTCHPGSAAQSCLEQCVEACECEPGFILSGSECVPQSQCGCTNDEGRYFKIQEQWFNPDCKEICTCEGNNHIHCQPWKCGAQEVCGHKDGILGCHAQGEATCIVSGDPHYLTFDGSLHHFMGTCTYVLSQPCWSNSQDNNFVVSATNEIHNGNLEVSSVKAVHVQVFDLKISLLKGRRVVLNNQRVALPVWALKGLVTIRLSGIFVLLYTNFGLQVRYDGNHLVEVTVPSSYTGLLCGLCGNYNNNSLDDNLRPDTKPVGNSLLLGTAWKILEASEPGCFVTGGKSSSCDEDNMDETWSKRCAILMNPIGPFANCHEVVPPQASFSSCVYGQCGTKGDTLALCRSLQAYASLCAQAGQMTTWRNSTFCPLRCPPRSIYNPCANPCPATCLTLSTPRDCPDLPCVEGCECQKGHILSGTTCVPLRQCGCNDQAGFYHLLGESWYTEKTCTTLCTCSVHSNVTCSQTACEANHVCLRQDGLLRCAAEMGECHLSEDSQIVSFDGHSHPIQDTCTYILVKVCHPNMNLPFFTISAKVDKDTHSKTKTYSVYELYIDIFSFRVILEKQHSVMINDTLVTLPAMTQIPGVSITTEDVYTVVTIKDEVQVKFESNSFLDIKIPASSNGKVCGVCGNFNGEEEDELMIPSDEIAQDEQEFMESWRDKDIDPNCQKIEDQNIQVDQHEIMNGKCRPIDFQKARANCQTALQGPSWVQCASRVPLKPFLLGCMNSYCKFRELFRALCEALESFEDACQNQGLKPPIWRNSSFCALQCPANSQFTDCLPSCPPSCSNLDGHCEGVSTKVPATCKEGCLCHPGFVFNEDKCIPRIQCGCKDTQGTFIPAGKTWTSRGCTQSCTCIGGTIQCQNFQCPQGTYCHGSSDGHSNCTKIPLHCPAHSRYTNCVPFCLPSCSDPDGLCRGTSHKALTTCKEGCVCKSGFVLHNDKCMLRILCDCKDAQGTLIPADKTWINRGCTQTCTCVGGAILCRKFECPSGTYCKDLEDGNSNCTKITLQCPAHSHYTNCLPSCLPSCSDPDAHCEGISTKKPSTCKEGCVCKPGYVLRNDKCILRIQCGCKDAQGALIPTDKTWINRGCTQTCTCMGGAIQCQNFHCPSGTYCKNTEDGNSNCAKITVQCPAHSHFTSCLPTCPPSCSTLDGHCDESSSRIPATCQEGCLCQPGYLLSSDKCVLRIQCGCKDGQGGLIPAGKTWTTSDCRKSCNCMGGTIQCRDFQCPPETYCKDNSDGSTYCAQITLQCPAHSRYTSCLPPCLPSCTDLDGRCEGTSPRVPATCSEGCLCQPGYVLHNDKCMLQVHCGCKGPQGDLIPSGKTWISRGCTQSCTCMGGAVQCHNFSCPPGTQCQDGQDGNVNCVKISIRCPARSRYTSCLPLCLPSCSDPEGTCGGTSPTAPSTCKEGCICRSGFVLHNDRCMLRIHCNCKDAQGTLIPADKNWISRGCTQNCTCVAGTIHCRSFQCPQGTHCKDSDDGNSNCVKVALECPDHSQYTSCLPSCIPSCSNLNHHCEITNLKDPATCKEGCLCQSGFVLNKDKCVPRIQCGCKDSQGALIPAGKTWIATGCSQRCACMGGLIQCHDFQCPSGTQCQDIEDSSSNCAEITLYCPAHSRYTSCLPSCLPSCEDPEGLCKDTSPKDTTCKEGCICQSGYVLHNDECILRVQCGCKDAQGALIPDNKTWISSGCTRSCVCTGGTIQCRDFKCPTGSFCQHNVDGSSSCTTSAVKCPAHSLYTSCLPSCLPSCLDPEGLCKGSSTKTPSTCKEGCVCRSGYVLHNDKCVLRIHCGCKVSQGTLIQTGQTWISTDCTQICACEGGLFQCQNFQCPLGTQCEEYEDGSSNCVSNTFKCPANSLYTSCLPSCLPTCSYPNGHCEDASTKVPSTCTEGCVCRPGYLLSNDKCVPTDQCVCKDSKGDIIPSSKTWISSGCTQTCTCLDGVIRCRDFICPLGSHCQHSEDGSSSCAANKLEKCTIFGDPYYHTFDGFTYHFLGRMNYYLIKTVSELPYGIQHLVTEGRNKISSKGSPTLHEVTTIVYGYKIQLQEGLVVLVNNQKVAIPYNPSDHLRIILRAQRLLLITDFEMVVDFDGKHSAVISLPTMYRGLIQGLCGNYDKNPANDLMLPDGAVTSNLNVFGNSWEVRVVNALLRLPRALPEEDGGEEDPSLLHSECSPEQLALISSTQACSVLVDPQGPFAACHQIIAPEPFEQHCMADICTGWKTKEEELRCRVLSGYAIICQEAGANLTGWRDQTQCAMTCPANTVYQHCMTPCPASCAKFVTPKVCEGPCMEGCASIPGYIYSDTQSLPVTQCGCTTNGIYYKLGDSFVTDNCSQHCTCASQGMLLCEPYGCRDGESCTVSNFTRGCFRDGPCLQNPCHNDGRCQERGATFVCHCDLGYGGEFCTEPRDIPPRKILESSSLVAILPGVLVMVLVPVLLPRIYVYMATRTALARRRGEKLLRPNRHRLEDTDVPEPAFKVTEF
ncbi:zonadhesin [Sigmodon hispidus]